MSKVTIKTILHQDLTNIEIQSIIRLKQFYWKYSYESQLAWMRHNLKSNDIHVLIFSDEILAAYLNIVHLVAYINYRKLNILGIGNVCVNKNLAKKGLGSLCINEGNNIISKNNSAGVLLCDEKLIAFYSKLGWIPIEASNTKIIVSDYIFKKSLMVYNFSDTEIINNAKIIKIDRNF